MNVVTKTILAVALLTPASLHGQETPTQLRNIHLAALQGDIEVIQEHIQAGSNLNAKDTYGSTPLIVAASFGNAEVARALIDAGAELNITNNAGGTALHAAAFFCRTEIVEALLDNGADKLVRASNGNTAFDAVAAPFDDVIGVYDSFRQAFEPLGLVLDYERIRRTRPHIAEMLRPAS